MTHVYPREAENWQIGDLAYCVSARAPSMCKVRLEVGRVYRVSAVAKSPNIWHHALRLEGFDWPEPHDFFWSNRFIKLGRVGARLGAISAALEYSPSHYWPKCQRIGSGNRHWKRRQCYSATPAA